MLNQGLITTMVTDTDTHAFANLETAGGRTWAASSTDDPPSISPAEMTQSIRAGKAVGGQELYVQTRLVDAADRLERGRSTLAGSTLLHRQQSDGRLLLEIDVRGAALGRVRHHPGLRQRGDDPVSDECCAGAVRRHADDDARRRERISRSRPTTCSRA